MLKKIKQFLNNIKKALQSPPGRFIACLIGSAAASGLATKIISDRREDKDRIFSSEYTAYSADTARTALDALNNIQQREYERIAGLCDELKR